MKLPNCILAKLRNSVVEKFKRQPKGIIRYSLSQLGYGGFGFLSKNLYLKPIIISLKDL